MHTRLKDRLPSTHPEVFLDVPHSEKTVGPINIRIPRLVGVRNGSDRRIRVIGSAKGVARKPLDEQPLADSIASSIERLNGVNKIP